MYTRITKSGGWQYLQLVEAYRNDRGQSRVRVIANLGRLDRLSPAKLDPLIDGLNRALGRTENTSSEIIQESGRSHGDVFALHCLWRELGIDRALRRALGPSRRRFDVEALIRVMVFNRLCAPDSKLGCLRWLETVAMPAIPDSITHRHLLQAMDTLMDHLDPVEDALAKQLRPLVDHDLTVVFHDPTTVRTRGEGGVDGDLRAHGMNGETGRTARQFVLGIVQTAEGLPLMHTVHPGNVAETKTVREMVRRVLKRFPVQRVILVADRGLLGLENVKELTALVDRGGRRLEFILAVPARRQSDLVPTFEELKFGEDGLAEATFADHRPIVAHDPVRAEEQSERRRSRIAELEGMADGMVARLDARDAGRTLRGRRASDRGAYGRFARAVSEAHPTRFIKADLQAERFGWFLDDDAIADAEPFDGKLVLLTNAEDLSPAETVARYKALADIERGFRVLKSDIEIAPVYHRLPDRIKAHAMICFLALVLHRVMRMRLKASGHDASPRTALELLARIQKHTTHVGTRTFDGISRTTREQLDLFKSLDLPKPG